MKIEFERKDIEAMLLAKARELGLPANKVDWSSSYYSTTATVSIEVVEPAPAFEPIDVIKVAA